MRLSLPAFFTSIDLTLWFSVAPILHGLVIVTKSAVETDVINLLVLCNNIPVYNPRCNNPL